MTEWNIQSRAHACSACGKSFVDQETYHTLLMEGKAELQRIDLCQGCWAREFGEGSRDRKGFISYWHGLYEAPPPPSDPIQKENAESLLRKLIALNDPRYIPAGYILAVMLERKRLLKVKEQIVREGRRVFIYEQPKTGDLFTIIDPNLQLNQLQSVQHDVAALLENGLDVPEPPGPAVQLTLPQSENGTALAPVLASAATQPSGEPAPETASGTVAASVTE
jgi:hypothetical protein